MFGNPLINIPRGEGEIIYKDKVKKYDYKINIIRPKLFNDTVSCLTVLDDLRVQDLELANK